MKTQHLLTLTLLAGLALTGTARADVVSDVATARDEAVVVSSATAEATLTMSKNLAPGKVPGGTMIGAWVGKVSGGTVAYRINRSTNPVGSYAYRNYGSSTNTRNPSSIIDVYVVSDSSAGLTTAQGGSTTGWLVPGAGNTQVDGRVAVAGDNVLTPGTYPVGIDIAAWVN